ncbi:MAG: hypothetical protein ACLT16_13220 [[Clostridium] innocuum]
MQTLGITYLNKLMLEGYNFDLNKEGCIDIKGFSDSNFGTERTVSANTVNYLDRYTCTYKVSAKDDSYFLTSKMHFDTTLTAGYKDSRGDRLTVTSREHVRILHPTNDNASDFGDNSELDVGYKAIGSYMLDFRRYLNAVPTTKDPTRSNYIWQNLRNTAI